jgi:hypothetical protein
MQLNSLKHLLTISYIVTLALWIISLPVYFEQNIIKPSSASVLSHNDVVMARKLVLDQAVTA